MEPATVDSVGFTTGSTRLGIWIILRSSSIFTFTVSNPDETIVTDPHGYLGDAVSLWGSPKNKLEFLLNAPQIGKALRDNEYDIVHIIQMDTIVFPTALSAVDVPVVIGPNIGGWSPVRDVPHWEEGPRGLLENRLRYVLKNAIAKVGRYDHAIAFSEYHRDILTSFSIPENAISVLEPGVDAQFASDERHVPNDPPELLYVGDFSEHKGYSQFLHALARLDQPVTARLLGAGDPDRSKIAALGLQDVVTVEGFVDRGDLPEYYRRGDLVVIPTINETAGTNAQIEALASGTP